MTTPDDSVPQPLCDACLFRHTPQSRLPLVQHFDPHGVVVDCPLFFAAPGKTAPDKATLLAARKEAHALKRAHPQVPHSELLVPSPIPAQLTNEQLLAMGGGDHTRGPIAAELPSLQEQIIEQQLRAERERAAAAPVAPEQVSAGSTEPATAAPRQVDRPLTSEQ